MTRADSRFNTAPRLLCASTPTEEQFSRLEGRYSICRRQLAPHTTNGTQTSLRQTPLPPQSPHPPGNHSDGEEPRPQGPSNRRNTGFTTLHGISCSPWQSWPPTPPRDTAKFPPSCPKVQRSATAQIEKLPFASRSPESYCAPLQSESSMSGRPAVQCPHLPDAPKAKPCHGHDGCKHVYLPPLLLLEGEWPRGRGQGEETGRSRPLPARHAVIANVVQEPRSVVGSSVVNSLRRFPSPSRDHFGTLQTTQFSDFTARFR